MHNFLPAMVKVSLDIWLEKPCTFDNRDLFSGAFGSNSSMGMIIRAIEELINQN